MTIRTRFAMTTCTLLTSLVLFAQVAVADEDAKVRAPLIESFGQGALQFDSVQVNGAAVSGRVRLWNRSATLRAKLADGGVASLELDLQGATLDAATLDRWTRGHLVKRLPKGFPLQAGLSCRQVALDLEGGRPRAVRMTLSTAEKWVPLSAGSFSLGEIALELRVELRTRWVTAKLMAKAMIGRVGIRLSGMAGQNQQLVLVAQLRTNTTFGDLLSFAAQQEAQLRPLIGAVPSALRGLNLGKYAVTVRPRSKEFQLKASFDMGNIKLVAKRNERTKKLDLKLALAPNAKFRWARFARALAGLDQLPIAGQALVLSSGTGDLAAFADLLGAKPGSVGRGVNLVGRLELRTLNPRLSKLLKVDILDLRDTLSTRLEDTRLSATARFQPIALGRALKIEEVGLSLRPSPSNLQLSISGRVNIQVDGQNLPLIAELGVKPRSLTLQGTLRMPGRISNALGIRQLELSNLRGSFGVTFGTGIPLPTLGMSAHVKFGRVSGSGSFDLDPGDPINSRVQLRLARLSVADLLDAAVSRRTAATVKGVAGPLASAVLTNVHFKVAPKEGFRIAGTLQVMRKTFSVEFDVNYEQGLTAKGAMSPLDIANGALRINGYNGRGNPSFEVALTKAKQLIAIQGQVQVAGGLMRANASLYMKPTKIELRADGQLFGRLAARLELTGTASLSNPSFRVKGTMKQSLLATLNQHVRNHIKNDTKSTVAAIKRAKQALRAAENELAPIKSELKRTRKRYAETKDLIEKGLLWTKIQTLIGSRKTAKAGVDAATLGLNVYKRATKMSGKMALWIVDHSLATAFDLRSMSFEAALGARTAVFDVSIAGASLGKPFAKRVRVDLRNTAAQIATRIWTSVK